MTDLTAEQIAHRGRMAATFLASDTWTELVDRIEHEGFRRFKHAQSTPEEREATWVRLQAFEDVARVLRAIRDRANLDTEG